MLYNKDIINLIENKYSSMRSLARIIADKNLETVKSDRIYSDVENSLKGYNFELAKAKYDGDLLRYEKLSKEKVTLTEKLNKRLLELGFTEKDLSPVYNCTICNDTGKVNGGRKCKCYYLLLNEILLNELGIEEKKLPTFSNDTLSKKYGLTKKYDAYKKYVNNFDETDKITNIFTGKTGTGKTFLAGAICSEIKKSGRSAIFLTAFDLNKLFLGYHTQKLEDKQNYIDLLTEIDLLVIDELGIEPILKNVTVEYLYLVINTRQQNKKHTIITTNLSLEELAIRYGERLLSRLTSKSCNTVSFDGDDLRKV